MYSACGCRPVLKYGALVTWSGLAVVMVVIPIEGGILEEVHWAKGCQSGLVLASDWSGMPANAMENADE